jgi:hypothetical protein
MYVNAMPKQSPINKGIASALLIDKADLNFNCASLN